MIVIVGTRSGERKDALLALLREICADADLQMASDGTVSPREADYCTRRRDQPLPPSCRCLCAALKPPLTIRLLIEPNLEAYTGGRTEPVDSSGHHTLEAEDHAVDGTGTDVEVYVEGRDRYRERRSDTREWMNVPDWLILVHELCGHAVPMMQGHHPGRNPLRDGFVRNWHDQSDAIENEIRDERALPAKGTEQSVRPGMEDE